MPDPNLATISVRTLTPCPTAFGALETQLSRHFGGPPADIEHDGLQVRIGDRPLAFDLRRLYREGHGQPPPPAFRCYDLYDVWLVRYSVGLLAAKGLQRVRRLGFRVQLDDPVAGQCIDLLPRTRVRERFSVGARFTAMLSADGVAGVGAEVPDLGGIRLGGGANLLTSSALEMVGTVGLHLCTPEVQAVGIGSSRSEWCFEAVDGQPLLGDQLMFQTLLVPQYTERLTVHLSAYIGVRARWSSFACEQLETEELAVSVTIQQLPAVSERT